MSPGSMRSSAHTTGPAQSWPRFALALSKPMTTGQTRRQPNPKTAEHHCPWRTSHMAEGVDHLDSARADNHNEQGREDAQQHREQDLDRHFLSLLLSFLPTDQSHLHGLFTKHTADRQAQPVCL